MGKSTDKGFVLEEPNVQVFERKPKDKAESVDQPSAPPPTPAAAPKPAESASAPPPQVPAPKAPAALVGASAPADAAEQRAPASARSPSTFALEQQVRGALLDALSGGQTLEALCTRHGLPQRRVQELVEQKESTLTEAQKQTLLSKLLVALRVETVGRKVG
jgi:hypothetical protein